MPVQRVIQTMAKAVNDANLKDPNPGDLAIVAGTALDLELWCYTCESSHSEEVSDEPQCYKCFPLYRLKGVERYVDEQDLL